MFNFVLTGQTMWSKDSCRWNLPVKWVSMFPKFVSIRCSFSAVPRFPIAVSEQCILFGKSVRLRIVNNILRLKSYSWRRNSSLPKSRETRMTEPRWRSRVSCTSQYSIKKKYNEKYNMSKHANSFCVHVSPSSGSSDSQNPKLPGTLAKTSQGEPALVSTSSWRWTSCSRLRWRIILSGNEPREVSYAAHHQTSFFFSSSFLLSKA